jgi:DNA-binding LacI/PurR family transcriptional regulator
LAANITQKDLAELLGISVSTVSMALRDDRRISEPIREKVHNAAVELGYTYHLRQSSQTIIQHFVFINPWGGGNEFYATILSGAGRICQQNQIGLRYAQVDEATSQYVAHNAQVDAFLLAGSIDEHIIRQFIKLNRPMILIDNNLPDLNLDRVLINNSESVYRTVLRLAEDGHKNIAFINGPTHPSFIERLAGYRSAMRELGLPVQEMTQEVTSFVLGRAYMAQWIKDNGKPTFTAIIGCNDEATIGSMQALQEAGCRIPDEISVVGFDDISAAAVTNPGLTTHHVHRELMGEMATRMLIERVANPNSPNMTLSIDTTYIERGSTRRLPSA